MEVLDRYGTEEQKREWLDPLLDGRDPLLLRHDRAGRRLLRRHQHREPHRAATATTTSSTAASGGPSGAPDPRCKIFIFMGKTDPAIRDRHKQQSMILVPRDAGRQDRALAAGVRLRRRAARPRRGAVRGRRGAALQHAAGRGPRLRDRARPARAGPHPSLHARDRPGRGGAGEDVPPRAVARRLRQADRRADGHAGAHRRGAHR